MTYRNYSEEVKSFSHVRLLATPWIVACEMSDSVQPHRRQPTRLLRPWDSPGKNTGVGCHFLLQCMKVKSEREVTQPCLTLSDPMDCSPPGSSIQGICQARVPEWGAIAFSDSILSFFQIIIHSGMCSRKQDQFFTD